MTGRVLLLALVLASGPALRVAAHEGETHGESRGEAPGARAPEGTLPGAGTLVAESAEFELVLKHDVLEPARTAHLHFFLSDWATNRPIEGATLDVTPAGTDTTLTATSVGTGVFELDLAFQERGYRKLDVVVRAGERLDLLAFDSVAVGVAATGLSGAAGVGKDAAGGGLPAWAFAGFALLGLAVGLALFGIARTARRSRRRDATLLVPFVALMVLTSASEVARAQSAPGTRFMAKEAQFLLGLSTAPARTERIAESRTAFGTVIADPAAAADLLAPQAGKFIGRRTWRVGDRIARGQEFGELLVVDAIPVRAPIGGLIAAVHAVPGQTVAAGQLLARVVHLDRVRVEIPLYGETLAAALRSVRAEIRVSALPDRIFTARIEGLAPDAAAGSGPAIPLALSVANAGGVLRPGMVVEATLFGSASSERVTVPASAILRTEQGPVTFVKVGAESFALRRVTLGARTADRVVIERGVGNGERVVTAQAYPLLSVAEIPR